MWGLTTGVQLLARARRAYSRIRRASDSQLQRHVRRARSLRTFLLGYAGDVFGGGSAGMRGLEVEFQNTDQRYQRKHDADCRDVQHELNQ